MTFNTPNLLPVGTAVTLLADTFGEHALTATIAGHVVYAHPVTGIVNQPGYALHLDQGFFAPTNANPGLQPWVGTIVAHVESVERRHTIAETACECGCKYVTDGRCVDCDERRPTTGERTTCATCQLDVEFWEGTGWIDRGNNRLCPDRTSEHVPA